MKEITFPARKSKIIDIRLSDFPGSTGTVYAAAIETQAGDNFSAYAPSGNFYKTLKVGTEIEYVLTKVDGKTKVKSLTTVKAKKMKPLISNLDNIPLESLLFIDIETVRVVDQLEEGTPLYESWAYKRRKEDETTSTELVASFADKAPLYSEFAKIVCISIGMVKPDGEVFIQSYYGDLEKEILTKFVAVLAAFRKKIPDLRLCGHAIIGFDVPFIMRRLIVNGIRVPDFLNVADEKPWTLGEKYIDTAQWWKGSGFYGASLNAIAVALDIPSPKQEIDGSQVSDTYYNNGLIDVVKYCENDVFASINILQHLYNSEKSSIFTSKTFENEQKQTKPKKRSRSKSTRGRVSRR